MTFTSSTGLQELDAVSEKHAMLAPTKPYLREQVNVACLQHTSDSSQHGSVRGEGQALDGSIRHLHAMLSAVQQGLNL